MLKNALEMTSFVLDIVHNMYAKIVQITVNLTAKAAVTITHLTNISAILTILQRITRNVSHLSLCTSIGDLHYRLSI